MDKREAILFETFCAKNEDCRTRRDDIKEAIKKNPDIDRVYLAMDEHAKQMSLDFLEFTLQKMHGHSVDASGKVEVKYNGEWITIDKLFENFL
jgi:hypothetical protein